MTTNSLLRQSGVSAREVLAAGNPMGNTAEHYQTLCDAINEVRDELAASSGEEHREERDQLREQRDELISRMGRVHDQLLAQTQAAIDAAPVVRKLLPDGRIQCMQSAGRIGGRVQWVTPRDAAYGHCLAEIEAERLLVERIFAAAGLVAVQCQTVQHGCDADGVVRLHCSDRIVIAERHGDVLANVRIRPITLGTTTHAKGYVVTRRLGERKYWSAVSFDGTESDHDGRADAVAVVS